MDQRKSFDTTSNEFEYQINLNMNDVGNMVVAELMQSVKVVIDGNLLWKRKLDDDKARI